MSKGWTTAIQALGAAAGLGLLATFVGGAMLWLRFDALDLPADRAVALLPKEMLMVVGAHALVVPVLVGLLALLVVVLMDPLDDGVPTPGFRWRFLPVVGIAIAFMIGLMSGVDILAMAVVAIVALLGIGAMWLVAKLGTIAQLSPDWRRATLVTVGGLTVIVVALLLDELSLEIDADVPVVAAAVVAGGIGAYLIFRSACDTDRVAYVALVTFAVFTVLGALLGVSRTYLKPRMEPMAALLKKDGRGIAGFFVGETNDRLYLVSLPSNGDPGDPLADADADSVVSVPRSTVVQVAMREPTGVHKDEPGRAQANTLLADLKEATAAGDETKVDPVTTVNPQVAFAPLVHLHVDEDLLPMNPRAFIDNAELRWSNVGTACERDEIVAVGAAVADKYAGTDPPPPKIAYAKLGREPEAYEYGPGKPCLAKGKSYKATAHTRPHDRKRDNGLGEAQGFYLDVKDELHTGHEDTEHEGPQRYLRDVPIYVEQHEADRTIELTYWFFYGLSRPPGVPDRSTLFTHEGDWERIAATVERIGPSTSNQYKPISVRYFHHDDSRLLPWYAVRKAAGNSGEAATHPIVYSAKGSHASYWRAGRYESEYKPAGKRLFVVNDDAIACQECPQWQTWQDVRVALDQRWYGFGGAWGDVSKSGGETGPLGPSSYKIDGKGTPTTETAEQATPVPSAPLEVQELVRGDD